MLKHVVHLKMLRAYGPHIRCRYEEAAGEDGVLLLLPTRVSPFDAQVYPSTAYMVLLRSTGPHIARKLVGEVPVDCSLVFKLIDGPSVAAVNAAFPVTRVTAYLSYTSHSSTCLDVSPRVIVSNELDERCLPLYGANGYMPEEVRTHFAHGAISFVLYEGKAPVSTCFAFANFQSIWEIAGLHTVPDRRRRGYAREVVGTAVGVLCSRSRTPRYQVREDNVASRQLAASVGLVQFLKTEHFLCQCHTPVAG